MYDSSTPVSETALDESVRRISSRSELLCNQVDSLPSLLPWHFQDWCSFWQSQCKTFFCWFSKNRGFECNDRFNQWIFKYNRNRKKILIIFCSIIVSLQNRLDFFLLMLKTVRENKPGSTPWSTPNLNGLFPDQYHILPTSLVLVSAKNRKSNTDENITSLAEVIIAGTDQEK